MDYFQENIRLGEVFVQLVAFLTVFFVLRKFAWKPLANVIKARREKLDHEWTDIGKMKAQVAELQKEYEEHLRKIEDEAREKLQEAVQEGRRIAREIQEKARSESQISFEKAKTNIEIEFEKARFELKREIAKLSLQIAEKVVREKMDAAQHEKRAMELIEELEKKL